MAYIAIDVGHMCAFLLHVLILQKHMKGAFVPQSLFVQTIQTINKPIRPIHPYVQCKTMYTMATNAVEYIHEISCRTETPPQIILRT